MSTPDPDRPAPSDAPPLFDRWSRWYALVLVELALIMAAAYWLTEAYR